MEVRFTPAALTALKSLPRVEARRLVEALRQVAESYPQRPGFVTELRGGAGLWRARKGDYRALYRLAGDPAVLVVEAVGHRKEIYDL